MNMPKYTSENYEGDERTHIDQHGVETVESYRLLLVEQNASGIDSWVVLKILVKKITELNFTKNAR